MKFIIGKKIEMTQVWQGEEVVAVTKVAAGPCTVTQKKTLDKDGYESVQLGFGEKKEKNINKPQKGHLKSLGNLRHLREFRVSENEVERGDKISVDTFEAGDIVNVTSNAKGRGFQGVVKRHGFSGSKKTHGNKDQHRMPGSVGATGPAHVFKGTRMGGRMGGNQVTTANLEIVKVDVENNVLYIKGSVSGARNGLVLIEGKGDLKFTKEEVKKEEVKKEEVKKEEVKKEDGKESEEVKTVEEVEVVKEEKKTEEVVEEKATSKDEIKK